MSNLPEAGRDDAFRALYEAVYPDVLRFVQRRTGRERAEDVVAQTFLVVWRRFNEAPQHEGHTRAWIFGIARNVLLNDQRGERRRDALGVRLATLAAPPSDDGDSTVNRVDLAAAWRRLSNAHQEALALAVFEDLTAPQAAAVLGISPVAFRLRLTRARRSLRLHLDDNTPPGSPPHARATVERTTTP